LTRRHRLDLLDPPRLQSLTGGDDEQGGSQIDILYTDETVDRQDMQEQMSQAWSHLDPLEQFVLEALVVNEQDAKSVLAALQKLDIPIKPGVAVQDSDIQQLYYFKRKALKKLSEALA
jgi:hypothetical protein